MSTVPLRFFLTATGLGSTQPQTRSGAPQEIREWVAAFVAPHHGTDPNERSRFRRPTSRILWHRLIAFATGNRGERQPARGLAAGPSLMAGVTASCLVLYGRRRC